VTVLASVLSFLDDAYRAGVEVREVTLPAELYNQFLQEEWRRSCGWFESYVFGPLGEVRICRQLEDWPFEAIDVELDDILE
jgi:hypothetical protein